MYLRRSIVCAFLLAPAAALSACDSTEPGGKAPPKAAPITTARPTGPASGHGTLVEHEVAWPDASTLDVDARRGLTDQARAVVDRAPVPALVVARPAFLEASLVMAKEAWYAVSSHHDGISIAINATKVAHRYDRTPTDARGEGRVRGREAFVTQNEGMWSATWVEHGAAYVLEIECNALPDPRCEDGSFLMSLAEDLRYVGGREASLVQEGSR